MFLCQVDMSCGNSDGHHEAIAFFFFFIESIQYHSGNQLNIIGFQKYTCFLPGIR